MNSLKVLVKRPISIILKLRARFSTFRLCREPNVMVKKIGEALKETLQNKVSPEEKIWIDKLENVRSELIASTVELPIVDYGISNLKLGGNENKKANVINRTVGEVCLSDSKQYFWSLFLFKLIRKFKPILCLELGTCLGISSSFQAAALWLNGNGKERLARKWVNWTKAQKLGSM